jgi:erythromycin esterase-like protein
MTAVASWKQIMDHIEGTRQSYFAKGVTAKDIDWAAQNVRIVLQCMQMKSGTGSRDQSMAENIKWIADHSPGAKIVVWAHNGHISTNSARGFGAMGASLRSMFGNQMVVFGLAFNQGSFQAVESGKGLRNFTVPPAPMGGLDSTLAATGIPVFAFDLRAAPKDGPIAVWLNQSLHYPQPQIEGRRTDEREVHLPDEGTRKEARSSSVSVASELACKS